MQIKNIYIGLVALFIGTSACINDLELIPTDRVTEENYYNTPEDALSSLLGAYKPLEYQGWKPHYPSVLINDIMSDDMYKGGGVGEEQGLTDIMRFNANPNTPHVAALWGKSYNGIARANALLDNYEQINFNASDENKAIYKAEAQFLRGHYYFELVRYFENIPLITTSLDADSWKQVEQSPVDDVYAQIAKDMLEGANNMAKDVPHGRLTKYAAKAELAKVFLFYTGYYNKTELPVAGGESLSETDVLGHLNDIITSGKFDLSTPYDEIFKGSGNFYSGAVFDIPFVDTGIGTWTDGKTGNTMCKLVGPVFTPEGQQTLLKGSWAFGTVNYDLYEAFPDDDPRRDYTIITVKRLLEEDASGATKVWPRWQHTGLFNFKYTTHYDDMPLNDVNSNWPQNIHYIRYSDVLLMAAELDFANATSYVDQVRARVGLPSRTINTKEDLFEERRLELALEGLRYWDILRQGLDYAESKLTVNNYTFRGQMIPGNGERREVATGEAGVEADFIRTFDKTKKGFLPIPQWERDLNPKLNQNSGYNN